jgi:subtilase family serine protease
MGNAWLSLAAVGALSAASIVGSAPAAPSRHVLSGSRPGWLSAAVAQSAAPVDGTVRFGLLLGMRETADARSTLRDLSNPDSPMYGRWLTSEQFRDRYSPAAADVAAVRDWLAAAGLRPGEILGGGMYLSATGTTAQVEKVFGTALRRYAYDGRSVLANSTALSLPADAPAIVTRLVAGVLGLDQNSQFHVSGEAAPPPMPGMRYGTQPCSRYYGQRLATDLPAVYGATQPYAVCGYEPRQVQAAYGERPLLDAGFDGRGTTVAVVDAYASPTMTADLARYGAAHGVPLRPGQYREIKPADDGYHLVDMCYARGWYGEQALDLDAVHTTAPGASVVYVGSADCGSSLDEAWARTIDDHVADVVTSSWTSGTDDVTLLGQALVDFYAQFSLQAALTGITVTFATGDDGDGTGGGRNVAARTVYFPADVPYVTGVGGTTVGIDAHGRRVFEHGWQTAYRDLAGDAWTEAADYNSGGGGGTSTLFTQPSYQQGVVPAAIASAAGGPAMRAVPDVALMGDPNTGLRVGQTQTFPDGTYYDEYRSGGTSLSAPLMAGLLAVAAQRGGHPLGFVDPLLYRLGGTTALRDITAPAAPQAQVRAVYNNLVDDSDGSFYQLQIVDVQTSTIHSGPGYDDETGVGSPGPGFVPALVRAGR